MSQDSRDWYRDSDSRPEPEGWGQSRGAWVLAGVVALAWLLPGSRGRLELQEALGLRALELPARAWTLVTYELLAPRGGGWMALAGLALLWVFARDVERDVGPLAMVGTFLAGAIVAGLAAGVLARAVGDPGTLTGTHGGTAALAVRWASRRRGESLAGIAPALVAAAAVLLPPFAAFLESGDRLAFAGVFGTLPGLLLERLAARGDCAPPESAPAPTESDAEPGEEEPKEAHGGPAATTRRRVDELLAKIQTGGIDALTQEERDFLAAASREFRDGRGQG